ncbi:MAG: type II toxin-antitoxin system VapC family toxin [Deltaproteobacteria bacterium]|nr:type II toxin-antitoxin system VapC family toxin [Deltaproteobacteria bacterium]
MKLLLDTHMLLWAAAGTLPKEAETLLSDPTNIPYFSPASIWEIVIKNRLGRDDFMVEPHLLWRGLKDSYYLELPIIGLHTLAVNDLPMVHKDPFDRILLAQAKSEGMLFLTSDSALREYPVGIIFIQ